MRKMALIVCLLAAGCGGGRTLTTPNGQVIRGEQLSQVCRAYAKLMRWAEAHPSAQNDAAVARYRKAC